MLRDSLFLIGRQGERAGVAVQTDIPDLPDLPLDAARLKQAFLNLATNAIDAMPSGGTLAVSATAGSEEIRLFFRDTGEGILADRLPLIFEPFYTSKAGGTGLGLSITYNIICEHGGRIEVESRPGEGSSFTLIFPLSA